MHFLDKLMKGKESMRKPTYAEMSRLWRHVKEYLALLWIHFVTQVGSTLQFLKVVRRYYTHFGFMQRDLFLLMSYLFDNPFSISKRFLEKKRSRTIYAYGETPLTSMERICKECPITPQDRVYELGCGRGRSCFWLNAFFHCQVVGIDEVPEFIQRATAIKNRFHLDQVEFLQEDFLTADYRDATVIYLYGTSLEEEMIKQLVKRFASLPVGTRVISVSYPLTEYMDDSSFEVMKRFSVPFPWGSADVYLQIKV
jgi:SAM-dependent methyltransferase